MKCDAFDMYNYIIPIKVTHHARQETSVIIRHFDIRYQMKHHKIHPVFAKFL